MPELVHIDGFEHGVASIAGAGLYDDVAGSPSIGASYARSGGYGGHFDSSGTEVCLQRNLAGTPAWATAVAYFRMSSWSIDGIVLEFAYLSNAVQQWASFGVDGAQNPYVEFFDGGSAVVDADTSIEIQAGIWYRVEMILRESGGTHIVEWTVATGDGPPNPQQNTVYSDGFSISDIQLLRYGAICRTAGSFVVDIDDVAMSVTLADDFLGPMKMLGYRPNAVAGSALDASPSHFFFKDVGGTETPLTSIETTSYETIDDAPMDADTDHIGIRAELTTIYADPNGPGAVDNWTKNGGPTTAWECLDDAVRTPTNPNSSGDGDDITSSSDEQQSDMSFSNPTYVAGLTWTLYIYSGSGAKRGLDVEYSVDGGSTWVGTRTQLHGANATIQWRNRTVAQITSQGTLDGFRVRLTCNSTAGGGGAGNVQVFAVYLEGFGSNSPQETQYAAWSLQDSDEPGDPIAVKGIVRYGQDTAAPADFVTKLVTTWPSESNIFNGSLTLSAEEYKSVVLSQAPLAGAWTQALLDGLVIRHGYTLDVDGTTRLLAAMVEAAFVPQVIPPPKIRVVTGPSTAAVRAATR